MILANISEVINKKLYLKLIKYEIKKTIKAYSRIINNILKMYSEDDIDNAIDTIELIGMNIYCPTSGKYGRLLRALEYGTNDTKACHILTYSTNKVLKEVSGHEFSF